jgi:hypothetical protein
VVENFDFPDCGYIETCGGNRVFVRDVIAPDVAKSLRGQKGRLAFDDWRLGEPLDWMEEFFPVSLGGESYAVIEQRNEGHPWHVDTGSADHMMWCKYTCSVGLSPRDMYTGGEFHFDDLGPLHHYLGMIAYTTDQRHMVTTHKGERWVLLMFFEGADG